MKPRDELLENPFAVLGASPRDSRERLIELADEAALFGDASANERLNQLLQPAPRLQAELCWFPSTEPGEVKEILDYARRDRVAPVPALRTDSTLARFNACRLFLAYWPVKDGEDALALCESLVIAERSLTVDRTVWEVRMDRRIAGMPGEFDRSTVAERMEELRRGAIRQAMEVCGTLNERDRATVFARLARHYGSGDALYRFNPFVALLVEEYSLTVEEGIRHSAERITQLRNEISASQTSGRQAVEKGRLLARQVERWAMLVGPQLALQNARKSVSGQTREFLRSLISLAERIFDRSCSNNALFRSLTRELLDICADILAPLVPLSEGIDDVHKPLKDMLVKCNGHRKAG